MCGNPTGARTRYIYLWCAGTDARARDRSPRRGFSAQGRSTQGRLALLHRLSALTAPGTVLGTVLSAALTPVLGAVLGAVFGAVLTAVRAARTKPAAVH